MPSETVNGFPVTASTGLTRGAPVPPFQTERVSPPATVESMDEPTTTRWTSSARTGSTLVCKAGQEQRVLQRIEAKVHERLFTRNTTGHIGRFAMLEQIGCGGMGTVHAAYDEQLDRKVAIKILRRDELPDDIDRLRFHREAQALARLSHPNVVTVHEVGEADGQLFLAMEFIRGQSIADWLRTEPDWRMVLDTFIQAGHGLVAAHKAGLVHRDLKPANIMRSDEGLVKVLDFGLARAFGGKPGNTLEVLTGPGVIVGTPAYMSPEQLQGKPVDASSDQFSFCVTLYEALYGERPYKGFTAVMLSEFNKHRTMRPTPRDTQVPAALRKVLMRGLELEPGARWPSINALLDALSDVPRRRRSRWFLGLSSAAVLASGLVWQATALAQTQPCTDAAQDLAGVWDEARSAQVQSAILGTGRSYAADVWSRTQQQLDGYARSWAKSHTEACEATTAQDESSPQLQDRQVQCLHRAAVQLRATVDTLVDADANVVLHAHELTAGLRPLSRCADAEAMVTDVERPGRDEAAAVEDVRLQLARAESLRRAGRYERAKQAVEVARALAQALEYGPVQAEIAVQDGIVLASRGEYEAAEEALEEALELASHWGHLGSMATAARQVMFVVGHRLQRPEEGLSYRPLVEGLARHDPLGPVASANDLAFVLEAHGELEQAQAQHQAVLSMRRERLGPDHPDIGVSRTNLGNLLRTRGRYRDAETEYRAALSLRSRVLGPEHPLVAASRNDLGRVLTDQGRYAEAQEQHRVALWLWQEALGSDHASVATARSELVGVRYAQRTRS